jgi:hypothetical protein
MIARRWDDLEVRERARRIQLNRVGQFYILDESWRSECRWVRGPESTSKVRLGTE